MLLLFPWGFNIVKIFRNIIYQQTQSMRLLIRIYNNTSSSIMHVVLSGITSPYNSKWFCYIGNLVQFCTNITPYMLRVPCNPSKLTKLQVFTAAAKDELWPPYITSIGSHFNWHRLSSSTVVLFSRDPPILVHTPKTAAHEEHPTNILHKEKYAHGIFLVTSKMNAALKQLNSYKLLNTQF